jgi:DNA mismatch repair protein MSH2
MVEKTIDLDQIKNHLYLIKPSYCPELKELKDRIDAIEEKIEVLADKV